MSHFNIQYLSTNQMWLSALGHGFSQLARTNPGWNYTLSTVHEAETTPDLYVLDLTMEKEWDVDRLPVNHSRLLILVQASQRKLIKQVLNESRCSLLCVDEHYFTFRDIVELCMRRKRFLSPFARALMSEQTHTHSAIQLTEAESKVLEYIRAGKSGVEMSQALFRSQKTISSHKRNIMRKFGVRDDLGLKQKLIALAESA
jgi:Response regulator containing a CheY-like receiver domain and an HTH DNA-binding domain